MSSFDPLSYVPIFDSNTVVVGTFIGLFTILVSSIFGKQTNELICFTPISVLFYPQNSK